jgi:hypothetical protein
VRKARLFEFERANKSMCLTEGDLELPDLACALGANLWKVPLKEMDFGPS